MPSSFHADDYIAISKKSTGNAITNNNQREKITFEGSSKDTKFGRRKGNIDDEEEDDDEVLIETPKKELEVETNSEEPDIGVWKGPDSSIIFLDCQDSQNDLREKLNNSNKKSAVQYRLMAPNNSGSRPRGIPTLLPLDFQINNNRNWLQRQGKRQYRGNRGYNNFQRGSNNTGNKQNNANRGGVNNGRVQKNRNQSFEWFEYSCLYFKTVSTYQNLKYLFLSVMFFFLYISCFF